jgi:hypothetical protein
MNNWKDEYIPSPTKLSTANATVSHKMLLNREGSRDATKAENKITFQVAITVMNMEALAINIIREIAFGVKIGDTKIWTALHEITIGAAGTQGSPTNPTIASVSNY